MSARRAPAKSLAPADGSCAPLGAFHAPTRAWFEATFAAPTRARTEQRAETEDQLKRGELRAIVAPSSLELGIDMGAVDLVSQIELPPSVAPTGAHARSLAPQPAV